MTRNYEAPATAHRLEAAVTVSVRVYLVQGTYTRARVGGTLEKWCLLEGGILVAESRVG